MTKSTVNNQELLSTKHLTNYMLSSQTKGTALCSKCEKNHFDRLNYKLSKICALGSELEMLKRIENLRNINSKGATTVRHITNILDKHYDGDRKRFTLSLHVILDIIRYSKITACEGCIGCTCCTYHNCQKQLTQNLL